MEDISIILKNILYNLRSQNFNSFGKVPYVFSLPADKIEFGYQIEEKADHVPVSFIRFAGNFTPNFIIDAYADFDNPCRRYACHAYDPADAQIYSNSDDHIIKGSQGEVFFIIEGFKKDTNVFGNFNFIIISSVLYEV